MFKVKSYAILNSVLKDGGGSVRNNSHQLVASVDVHFNQGQSALGKKKGLGGIRGLV